MKKLFVLLMVLFLTGCTSTTVKPEDVEEVHNGFIDSEFDNVTILASAESFDYNALNKFVHEDLQVQYTPTYAILKDGKIVYFNDLVMDLETFDSILKDIEKGTVNLYDDSEDKFREANMGKTFMETDFLDVSEGIVVVQFLMTTCVYCYRYLVERADTIYQAHPEIQFIDYFMFDNEEEVNTFLKQVKNAKQSNE